MQGNKPLIYYQRPSWRHAFDPYLVSPQNFLKNGEVFSYTEKYVVVKDKYPKSKVHYLILPRHSSSTLKSYLDIQRDFTYYDALFTNAAETLIQSLIHQDPSLLDLGFLQGFHASPSMFPLHYHILSKDFMGPGLKKKSHWNSFTTPFLVTLQQLRMEFPSQASLETLLKLPLRCPWCPYIEIQNIPRLKRHLVTSEHLKNVHETTK
ncbi:hypothetical protein HMI54_002491 [Coelomomyces lativittatus]|nr:hypothetical protein HMI55_002546 [Coelomomyces lativittatus]KAJ1511670.1 hypothetical protein HMI56_005104 [Coelomomyces lativittatus]KAJ1518109.1 hypothetical protein HMI54_002491 [Coelomomyces lativittatus]